MIRIGVISDTHIPKAATQLPKEILKAFKQTDLILHAGDLVEYYVVEELNKLAPCHAVYGNMDNTATREILPEKTIVKVGKLKIGLIHGFGSPKCLVDYVKGQFDKNIDVIVFGHSHSAFNETIGKTLFFNPGSATDIVYAPFRSYGMLYIDNDKIKSEIVKI